ncbi:hypothetical protein [Pelotomaculum propionicicum]|uniref:Aspartate ammonia-lyase n=1 Tax=Pelotomaculum propionicicum TaxID=258475 RepID=A0A4Y7RNQ9_9FIRM|nr:hypothetical protein [Pelotomaculum propionicicum]NLI12212.1 hypothetical protein [Peptococcaceae bacterium]TEB10628.1 hypothetical protein Pmgp_02208 [Pelotomaculum propionicicum]
MKTPQWIKKLGGHAGELYVAAELSKRGISNSLLTENFSHDDILAGNKDGTELCYIQVKSCHPDLSHAFILKESEEGWVNAPDNQFVVFVWLGSPKKSESPRFWIATKKEVGEACIRQYHGTKNWERRLTMEKGLNPAWENNWDVFKKYMP